MASEEIVEQYLEMVEQDAESPKHELLNNVMKGNWEEVVRRYKEYSWARKTKLTRSGETALHIAVIEKKEGIVKRLVELVDAEAEAEISPLMATNERGNTPLHLAASIGNTVMCKCMCMCMSKHLSSRELEQLLGHRNTAGETSLFLAALHGQKNAFLYLDEMCRPEMPYEYDRRADGETILHVAISGEYFDLAYYIIWKHSHLIYCVNENGYTPLHVLASKPALFRTSLQLGLFNRFIYFFSGIYKKDLLAPDVEDHEERDHHTPNQVWLFGLKKFFKKLRARKEKNICSLEIMKLLIQRSSYQKYDSSGGYNPGPISSMPDRTDDFPNCLPELWETEQKKENMTSLSKRQKDQKYVDTDSFIIWVEEKQNMMSLLSQRQKYQKDFFAINQGRETPILLAAKNGITEMVMEILEVFPTAILDKDSANKNIVHLAVENRQTRLYDEMVRYKHFYETLFRDVDNNGNTVLHLAATFGDYRLFPIATLQMQWEIKWFKYVKNSVPRDFFLNRNDQNMTAEEVFKKSHEELVKQGGKWIISTSNSCSVVATVVTTVAFATTAAIPGGIKEGSSAPNLEHDPGFIVFAISSLIALSFSLTSVIGFLTIITPRHGLKDFEKRLPEKLLYALTYLFISLAAMLVCFCAGHFYLMRDELRHNAFLVYGVVCLPVVYFAMKQFPFYFDLVHDIFSKSPRHLPS